MFEYIVSYEKNAELIKPCLITSLSRPHLSLFLFSLWGHSVGGNYAVDCSNYAMDVFYYSYDPTSLIIMSHEKMHLRIDYIVPSVFFSSTSLYCSSSLTVPSPVSFSPSRDMLDGTLRPRHSSIS